MSEDDAVLLETASIPAYNFRMSTCVHKCAQRDRYCPETKCQLPGQELKRLTPARCDADDPIQKLLSQAEG
jgi:rRNA maturation protein Nop10